MIYEFKQDQSLEDLNELGGLGWEIINIEYVSPSNFDAFLMKGKQGETLIETDNGNFWIKENFSYGESVVITFLFLFFMIFLASIIFNLFFRNE